MWIITQEGFYSVMAYDPQHGGERSDSDELIVVRTRERADLERIIEWIGDASWSPRTRTTPSVSSHLAMPGSAT
jgi:hypothetical protein